MLYLLEEKRRGGDVAVQLTHHSVSPNAASQSSKNYFLFQLCHASTKYFIKQGVSKIYMLEFFVAKWLCKVKFNEVLICSQKFPDLQQHFQKHAFSDNSQKMCYKS